MANFLAEHPSPEKAELPIEIAYSGLIPWNLYFDGSSTKYGQGMGIAIVSPKGTPTRVFCRIIRRCTHNRAEYEALILGLELAREQGICYLEIYGDSQLMIHQVTRKAKCNDETLAKCIQQVDELLTFFDVHKLQYIPRSSNWMANELAQLPSRCHLLQLSPGGNLTIGARILLMKHGPRRFATRSCNGLTTSERS